VRKKGVQKHMFEIIPYPMSGYIIHFNPLRSKQVISTALNLKTHMK